MNGSTRTPNVAIVGRPNVGKSALFNRLVGRQIAIVHDQPGITRDRISTLCTRGEKPFTLWDTGGVGGSGESELTAQVQGAVEEAMRDSDVLLFVVDAKQGLSPIDEELARMLGDSKAKSALAHASSALPATNGICAAANELIQDPKQRMPSQANQVLPGIQYRWLG